jgi:hypothetical protein
MGVKTSRKNVADLSVPKIAEVVFRSTLKPKGALMTFIEIGSEAL